METTPLYHHPYFYGQKYIYIFFKDEDPVLAKNRIRGSVPQDRGYFYCMNMLDNFEGLPFLFILEKEESNHFFVAVKYNQRRPGP